ncbi:MAG: hypothetical protein LBV59_04075 [Sphingobacterium sp.]|uniref:hypothetical protein n=1 Tax=Sphingobacterium sp. TaxID=341027 RepID=UPI002846386D|nr:hypothetical protein [Sphingobacterium sp.]MDR3007084.1 hypothetical protein [Sphingobacterium sp.]
MKDLKLIASMLLAICVLLNITNCQSRQDTKEAVKNSQILIKKEEAVRFKQELESLNKTNKVPVQIPDNARIVYATEQDVLEIENGIVLFGWPSCPWFRNAITPLLEFAQEEKATIYYLNIHDIRDLKEKDKAGKVITTKVGSPGYEAILAKFHTILNPYTAVGIDSIKRISSPTVLFIEKGKGVHKVVSTVVSQIDPKIKLDSTQRQELKQRYCEYFVDERAI